MVVPVVAVAMVVPVIDPHIHAGEIWLRLIRAAVVSAAMVSVAPEEQSAPMLVFVIVHFVGGFAAGQHVHDAAPDAAQRPARASLFSLIVKILGAALGMAAASAELLVGIAAGHAVVAAALHRTVAAAALP
ncbi:MAG: hypothetical protein HY922_08310 [Elusimicrobia bacterium]|nr:hypothetical protein [Elusimicrobiota bacterium]